MKNILFKLIFSVLFLISFPNLTIAKTIVSLSPSLTEIIYAIGAEDSLVGVSTECNYPVCVSKKEKIGNFYFFNKEKLLKNKPDYIFLPFGYGNNTLNYEKIGIIPIYFEINSVEDIYSAISAIGKITNKENNAKILVNKLKTEIKGIKTPNPKRILYLCQDVPTITIGNKSFISDVIKKSGQISVTEDLNYSYITVSKEYILRSKPDVIVVCNYVKNNNLVKLFPNTEIIYLSKEQNDILNRTSPRINLAVKFFANL